MPSNRNNSNISSKHRRPRDSNNSSEARCRRRHQNGPRRRRRQRREHRPRRPSTTGRCRDAASRRASSIIAAISPPPLPLPRRRRLSQWSWQPQRSRSPVCPRASPRKSISRSAAVVRTVGSPLSSTAPLEDRGSRGSKKERI